jgi:hypothetical protein
MRTGVATAAIQLLLLAATGAPLITAETGLHDDAFQQVPFEQWRAQGNQSPIPWSVEVAPPELSSHQRLAVAVKIEVDGNKLTRRRLKDHLLALVEFAGADGTVWQTHGSLHRQPGGVFSYTQNAFVLPGDYAVSLAVSDSTGLQHSFAAKKLQVPGLKHETLQSPWEGLPAVEFFASHADTPDGWFLPEIDTRLHLPVESRHPVHVDILLNTTPGDFRASDPIAALRRNMNFLIPALKILSQIDLRNGSMDIAFLDLTRQQEAGVTNWSDMKKFLAGANPGTIDVEALHGRSNMRGFFLQTVTGRMTGRINEPIAGPKDSERVLIVLSGPALFEGQEPAPPLTLPAFPAPRIFYIRCREIPRFLLEPRPRPRPGARPLRQSRTAFALPLDDLEQPLNTSGVRIYDVLSPEQFRRVLAAVMGQISRM